MWKTPGIWNYAELPKGSKIRATRRDTTLVGTVAGIAGESRDKRLMLDLDGAGVITLWAKDYWNVEFEVKGFNEIISASPIGTVWIDRTDTYPRFVKVSKDHVTKQAFRDGSHSTPEVFPILQFGGSADQFIEVSRNALAEEVTRA